VKRIGGILGIDGAVLLLAAAVASGGGASEPATRDEIVARCAEALGGADRIAAVRTLRFEVSYADTNIVQRIEIARPNRIRSEGNAVLVFDGARAAFLKGAPSTNGRDPGVQLVEAEAWRDFEVDIAFLFPAFFDYPGEYAGLDTLDAQTFHKIVVALPMGIRMTYFLDAGTFLPRRIVADFPYGGVVYHPERMVDDYRETGGVLFPRAFTSSGWGLRGAATVTSLELNVSLNDERFTLPSSLE